MNPIAPLLPETPETPPPPRDEPPTPKEPEPEPEDDIRKLGDKIGDAADEIADKVEAFRELLEDRQKDHDDALETLRGIGRALQTTGVDASGGAVIVPPDTEEAPPAAPPIVQPSPEEVANMAVAILNSQSETAQEVGEAPAEPDEKSGDGFPPWWFPWVIIAVGAVGWGITRKK